MFTDILFIVIADVVQCIKGWTLKTKNKKVWKI